MGLGGVGDVLGGFEAGLVGLGLVRAGLSRCMIGVGLECWSGMKLVFGWVWDSGWFSVGLWLGYVQSAWSTCCRQGLECRFRGGSGWGYSGFRMGSC